MITMRIENCQFSIKEILLNLVEYEKRDLEIHHSDGDRHSDCHRHYAGRNLLHGNALRMTDVQLSEHFWLHEFTDSYTARMLCLKNEPPPEAVECLRNLCLQVLEPLRLWAGIPVQISSGYRCPALNRAVGGAPHSWHLTGCAADLHLPSVATGKRWYAYLRCLPHTELLWEQRGSTTWIHVALRP
mgnify:CR=1 FL=1